MHSQIPSHCSQIHGGYTSSSVGPGCHDVGPIITSYVQHFTTSFYYIQCHHNLLYATFAITKYVYIFVEVSCIRSLFTQTDPGINVPGFCFMCIFVIRYVFLRSTDRVRSPGCNSPGFFISLLYGIYRTQFFSAEGVC